jgi:hypothetical protein
MSTEENAPVARTSEVVRRGGDVYQSNGTGADVEGLLAEMAHLADFYFRNEPPRHELLHMLGVEMPDLIDRLHALLGEQRSGLGEPVAELLIGRDPETGEPRRLRDGHVTYEVRILDGDMRLREEDNVLVYRRVPSASSQDGWPDNSMLEAAWGIIANAYGARWEDASDEWRGAAERWRDAYHRVLDRAAPPAPGALASGETDHV